MHTRPENNDRFISAQPRVPGRIAPKPSGEMDDSYKFEEEDVNARGGGGVGEGVGDDTGDGGKTPKMGRKKSFGKKKVGSSAPSSSAKKGSAKKARKS